MRRKSSLLTEDVVLSGHEGAVLSISFDPTGKHLCSGSFDRQIFLWDVYGECKNYNVLRGHKNAVLEVKWPTESTIVSCSADKTVAIWNANTGTRIRKLTEHTGVVNSCDVAREDSNIIASASDDCTVILWDARNKKSVCSMYHDYQVCSVCLSADGQYIFSGGIDNIIRRFDVRMGDSEVPDMALEGHVDTITGLSLSPDGHLLLSNAMDSTLRCWDIRPFASTADGQRCLKVIEGAHHGAEKVLLKCNWSPDQSRITCGSADRFVHVWETTFFQELYYLPGHKASVNQVIYHPTEPLIASCGSDRQIILGEYSL